MFRLTALVALLSSATALKANSPAGKNLLNKSSRSLENEDGYEWLQDFSLVFQSCHKVTQYAGEEAEEGESVGYINLVKYKLCPSNKCRYGCKGAEYVTDMYAFVDAYTEWQMNDQEYKCEQARESCQCQYYYGDEDVCEANCFKEKGMSQCIEENEDDKFEFDLQDYLECREVDAQDAYGNNLFVGPTCSSSGERINLGVFTDENCSTEYSNSAFIDYYGISLPYQSENIVAENCISCKQVEVENGYYKDAETTPICEESYPQSAKCESNIASYISYPSTSACEYIENIKLYEKGYKPVSGAASTFFAVVFGISTVLLAGVAVHLYKMNSRKIDLQTDAAVV
mmetsp:Transcript_14227/g.21552  ORF Transcript_14227/g.21552 Transcript_14227/m.21552 type:complete len:343 (+) Transcript_14227:86-1114(+)|eukprot:CAMPEP_0203689052 /NCGR_PEP_ID=MMETSP0091-20130426/1492_1 /ASSEMBLY_ACC=CAM_ASM_001089 /TAXON_ID=426623 /ORGANISM="Chaetoceros affinis, Strain CCMP159" /LENGTH=342 /DNA_ID=CAMNT_0050558625 /DNA_START=54 /DNA_END=1082 /DNA_ORIENTATION=+